MPDGQFGYYPYGQQNAWTGMIPGGGTTNATQSYSPYPTNNQGYNFQIPLPGMQDFGAWMTGGGSGNYGDYLNQMAEYMNNWMNQFQMQQPDWSQFWNGFRGMFGGMYGGGAAGPGVPQYQSYEGPAAPKVTGAPTPGPDVNANWNWQDFGAGNYQPGDQWSQQNIAPPSLQNVQGYIDAYAPYAAEQRQQGFDEAAQKFGATGMLMSTPYAQKLGEVERNTEADYNRLGVVQLGCADNLPRFYPHIEVYSLNGSDQIGPEPGWIIVALVKGKPGSLNTFLCKPARHQRGFSKSCRSGDQRQFSAYSFV